MNVFSGSELSTNLFVLTDAKSFGMPIWFIYLTRLANCSWDLIAVVSYVCLITNYNLCWHCQRKQTRIALDLLKSVFVATVTVSYLRPADNHFLYPPFFFFWISDKLDLPWITIFHFPFHWTVTNLCTDPDHDCLILVIGRELVKPCIWPWCKRKFIQPRFFIPRVWKSCAYYQEKHNLCK